jgi:hypothetical protein
MAMTLTIDLAAMLDEKDVQLTPIVVNIEDDSIIADAKAVASLFASELFHTAHTGIIGNKVYLLLDAYSDIFL